MEAQHLSASRSQHTVPRNTPNPPLPQKPSTLHSLGIQVPGTVMCSTLLFVGAKTSGPVVPNLRFGTYLDPYRDYIAFHVESLAFS